MFRLAIALALFSQIALSAPVLAKLGEPYAAFRNKISRSFRAKGSTTNDTTTHYSFVMVVDANQAQAAPGYGAGMTVTVIDKKVAGQAIVFRLGDYPDAGKLIAIGHALDFIYEAIGKPVPKSETDVKMQYEIVRVAAEQALGNFAQNIQFPGYTAKVKISRTATGDLLVQVRPDVMPTPAAKVPAPRTGALPPGSYVGETEKKHALPPGSFIKETEKKQTQ